MAQVGHTFVLSEPLLGCVERWSRGGFKGLEFDRGCDNLSGVNARHSVGAAHRRCLPGDPACYTARRRLCRWLRPQFANVKLVAGKKFRRGVEREQACDTRLNAI